MKLSYLKESQWIVLGRTVFQIVEIPIVFWCLLVGRLFVESSRQMTRLLLFFQRKFRGIPGMA